MFAEGEELIERRLAHYLQHTVFRMFRRYLQSAGNVAGYQFFHVGTSRPVQHVVIVRMQEKIIADTAFYERPLDLRQAVYLSVQIEQRSMVCIQVLAHHRPDITATGALPLQENTLPAGMGRTEGLQIQAVLPWEPVTVHHCEAAAVPVQP